MKETESTPLGQSALSTKQIWWMAITKPSVNTYKDIMNDPDLSRGRSEKWIFMSTFMGLVFSTILSWIVSMVSSPLPFGASFTVGSLFCMGIVACFMAVLAFAIYTGATNLVAKALGGVGTYSQLSYTNAAYYAPLALITTIVSTIPYIGFIAIFVGIYMIVLNVLSVQAVHGIEGIKSVIAGLSPIVLLALLLTPLVIEFMKMSPMFF